MLDNLKMDQNVEKERDVIGSNFGPQESDIYPAMCTMAYLDKSSGGAMSINLTFKFPNGAELRIREWITSGDTKGNKNYYENAEGEKKYLPGFLTFASICNHALDKEPAQLQPEKKTINIYDPDAKKELPTQKPVLVELIGSKVALGILKVRENKKAKVDGEWVAIKDDRTFNEISKVFDVDTLATTTEKAAKETPQFHEKWLEKFKGVLVDRYKEVEGGSDSPKSSDSSSGTPEPDTSADVEDLFN